MATSVPSSVGSFALLQHFAYEKFPISRYRSTATGLTVVHVATKGPLVHGFFTLSTEAHDDDGCPHTLEHLIFLGSEDYPYKGILDTLANKCLAQGTNAWTGTDHTSYTVSTAGSEGFLTLLPVYLDHILFPTLTDSGFHTEVHHINGEGVNAGVVYSEMQGRENNSESRMFLLLGRLLYPDTGYEVETGGIMKNLRSLTAETVRQYHRDFYRAENLCVIVTGELDTESLLKVVDSFDRKIASKGARPSHKRPWSHEIPPLRESYSKTIEFPTDDESIGSVYMSWRGPSINDNKSLTSLTILWKYLTESAISPLRQEFVENNPVCGSVEFSDLDYKETAWVVEFGDVFTDKLDEIRPRFFTLLNKIIKEGVDMSRIRDLVDKSILEHYNQLEEAPADLFSGAVIVDFLYSNSLDCLPESMKITSRLEELKQTESSYWTSLIDEYLLKRNYVEIKGKPSSSLSKQMADEEKERIQKQKDELGEETLKRKALELEEANRKNNIPAPESLFSVFPTPDPSKVPLFDVKTKRYEPGQSDHSDDALPFYLQLDAVDTKFVTVSVYIDTSNVPVELKPYLELYLDLMFELPVMRDGTLVPYEKIISELEADTVGYENSIGLSSSGSFSCGAFPQLLSFKLKAPEKKYDTILRWVRDILFNSKFTLDRVKVSVSKLLNEAISSKRSGSAISRAALRSLLFDDKKSNANAVNVLNQLVFLQGLKGSYDSNGEKIIENLNGLRTAILQPLTMYAHVSCSSSIIDMGTKPWASIFGASAMGDVKYNHKETVPYSYSLLTDKSLSGSKKIGYVFPLPSIESGFLVRACTGPQGFQNHDTLPLRVLIEYLMNLEGPMWKELRGLGLAYSYSSFINREDGLLYFVLDRASHLLQAYTQAKVIVREFSDGKRVFNETEIGGAKASVIFEIISQQETVGEAASHSMVNYFKRVSPSHDKELLSRVKTIGAEDLLLSLKTFYLRLFDEDASTMTFCVNPATVESATSAFLSEHGVEVKLLPAAEGIDFGKKAKKRKGDGDDSSSEDSDDSDEDGSSSDDEEEDDE